VHTTSPSPDRATTDGEVAPPVVCELGDPKHIAERAARTWLAVGGTVILTLSLAVVRDCQ
jgi:hypothetical protein